MERKQPDTASEPASRPQVARTRRTRRPREPTTSRTRSSARIAARNKRREEGLGSVTDTESILSREVPINPLALTDTILEDSSQPVEQVLSTQEVEELERQQKEEQAKKERDQQSRNENDPPEKDSNVPVSSTAQKAMDTLVRWGDDIEKRKPDLIVVSDSDEEKDDGINDKQGEQSNLDAMQLDYEPNDVVEVPVSSRKVEDTPRENLDVVEETPNKSDPKPKFQNAERLASLNRKGNKRKGTRSVVANEQHTEEETDDDTLDPKVQTPQSKRLRPVSKQSFSNKPNDQMDIQSGEDAEKSRKSREKIDKAAIQSGDDRDIHADVGAAPLDRTDSGKSHREAARNFKEFEKDPAKFSRANETSNLLCRKFVKLIYEEQSKVEFGENLSALQVVPKKRGKGLPPLGPILELDKGRRLDCDQLFGVIQGRNKPLLSHLKERTASLAKLQRQAKRKAKEARGKKTLDVPSEQIENANSMMDVTMAATRCAPVKDERRKEGDAEMEGGNEDGQSPVEGLKSAKKVRFAAGLNDEEARPSPVIGDVESVEDGFFSLRDMEAFADDAEELASNGKLFASDNEESDGSEDGESDGEESMAFSVGKGIGKLQGSSENLRYNDFFDPPSKSKTKASSVSALLGAADEEEVAEEIKPETPLDASRARTRKLIDAIEEESVAKKPWQLRGEVTGFSRPKDSLLEATMEHDTTLSSKAAIQEDREEAIEDIIRQRITDGLFDDVAPPPPDTYEVEKKKRQEGPPEVSQEKPTEGLAELYEKEFLTEQERAKDALKSKDVQRARKEAPKDDETPEQKEVNRLFEKLCSKLDALSALHFTPGPVTATEEMAVSSNVKALNSEEAIPEAISDENLMTPREVYKLDGKERVGEVEKSKEDKKAEHRKKKRGIKKSKEAKARAQRLMEQANPALAEKRKAQEAFERRGKKMRVTNASELNGGSKPFNGAESNGAFGLSKRRR